MLILRSLLYGIFLLTFSVQALQLNLESTDTDTQIMVSNDQDLHDVDVYLVWFNLDENKFKSLMASSKWKSGLLPVYSAIDIAPFETFSAANFDETCPEDQRCFLGLIATKAGENPINIDSWQASTLLPLNLAASRERLPGQQFFLPNDYVNNYSVPRDAVDMAADDSSKTVNEVAAAPEADEADGNIQTEKPDIFRLVGDKLLYANGAAKRFQVIDVSDVSNPNLIGWAALSGYPKELYVLNDYYILLQDNYDNGGKTELIVLQQGAGNSLNTVHEMTIPGNFIESRRRGNYIYSVSTQHEYDSVNQQCEFCDSIVTSKSNLIINVLELQAAGKLVTVDEAKIPGYYPQIAIFPDNLVIANHNPAEEKWQTTQIQVFDLTQSDPLVELPLIKVPGQVPSEFHLSVLNQELRVVYGPEDRTDGSSLAIYDLNSNKETLVGKVDKIAPGEGLFATRFVDDRAFVVTYERTDPLWVIDLADSSNPKILGELIVPGWSEKLFFNDNRLFAVGIDDQTTENEENNWARRVAISMFDVEDPTKPTLINRITPLVGQSSYSWSPALNDERALLLNWQQAFAALPINSWEADSANNLQIVSFADDELKDIGLLPTPTEIQRSLILDTNVLAGLGDQSLITLRWGVEQKPEVLGELELATNLAWLKADNDSLWSAATGNKGFNRLYRYNTAELEVPEQRWQLPKGYNNLLMDENMVVFYNYYEPLEVQVFDKATAQLSDPQQLEANTKRSIAVGDDMIWYDRRTPLLHDGWFYIAEQQPFKSNPNMILPKQEQDYWQSQWVLRSWNLQTAKEALNRSIPGWPLAITATGNLITQESNGNGQRLNLLALKENNAMLLANYDVPCDGYVNFLWAESSLYASCQNEPNYIDEPFVDPIEPMDVAIESPAVEEVMVKPTRDSINKGPISNEIQATNEDQTTVIMQLTPTNKGFVETGSWTLKGRIDLRTAINETVLVYTSQYWWYYNHARADMLIPEQELGCNVYKLIPQQEPVLLKHLETCSYNNDSIVLTPQQIWQAEGYAGIKNTKF